LKSGEYVTVKNITSLNIRNAPSLSGLVIGALLKNQYAKVLEISGDGKWIKISINNIIGWSYKDYLSYIY